MEKRFEQYLLWHQFVLFMEIVKFHGHILIQVYLFIYVFQIVSPLSHITLDDKYILFC